MKRLREIETRIVATEMVAVASGVTLNTSEAVLLLFSAVEPLMEALRHRPILVINLMLTSKTMLDLFTNQISGLWRLLIDQLIVNELDDELAPQLYPFMMLQQRIELARYKRLIALFPWPHFSRVNLEGKETSNKLRTLFRVMEEHIFIFRERPGVETTIFQADDLIARYIDLVSCFYAIREQVFSTPEDEFEFGEEEEGGGGGGGGGGPAFNFGNGDDIDSPLFEFGGAPLSPIRDSSHGSQTSTFGIPQEESFSVYFLDDALTITRSESLPYGQVLLRVLTALRDRVREMTRLLHHYNREYEEGDDDRDNWRFPRFLKLLAGGLMAQLNALIDELWEEKLVEMFPPVLVTETNMLPYRQMLFQVVYASSEAQRELLLGLLRQLSQNERRDIISEYGARCVTCGLATQHVSLRSLLPCCQDPLCQQ